MESAANAPMPQENQNQPATAMPSSHINKAIIASLAVVLVALIGITYFFFNKSKGPDEAMVDKKDMNENDEQNTGEQVQVSPLPDVQVAKWESTATAPVVPATATGYTIKQTFAPDEINMIAGKLGSAERIETTEKAMVGYSAATSSVMIFYPAGGKYMYSSAVGLALPAGATLEQSVYALLTNIGMYDPTIKVSGTYMRQDKPGMKYVELHRSWADMKLPILNAFGLANLPENTKLAQLSPTVTLPDDPQDVNITGTSDNTDGFKRKDDFNTITLGIDEKTQKVVYISSNMRMLMPEKTSASIISYDEAVAKIKNKEYEFFLSSPSGEGKLDIQQVYPGNTAMSEKATITDVALAYIEQPPTVSQMTLSPYYVVRGYMETKEGYRLKFTATVNAQASQPSAWNRLKNLVPNFTVNAQVGDPGQKQDTLRFPTQQAQQDISIYCKPSEQDMNPIYEYNGMRIGYGPRADKENVYEWWYINRADQTEEQILANVRTLFENIPTGVDDSLQFREKIEKLINEIKTTLPNCPVRFTGSSPTVFVYGDPGATISVVSAATTTYTEPDPGVDSKWDVTIKNTSLLDVEGSKRQYLYYEYAPVDFAVGTEGWVADASDMRKVARQIALQLLLTQKEENRLVFELNHAASGLSGKVVVKPISQAEINAKLPLSVVPTTTNVVRYHFSVSAAAPEEVVAAPDMSPVNRTNTMVLELGATAQ